MVLPIFTDFKSPILQELAAVGGSDHLKFMYLRLLSYFPTLSDAEILMIKAGRHLGWRNAIQKAGRFLEEDSLIRRERGFWVLTVKGQRFIESEFQGFIVEQKSLDTLNHQTVQKLLIEIGFFLGYYSEKEFAFFDVVWKKNAAHSRISHVFEVQSKGNIDSAFAKLKRAFDDQRSQPFLVVGSQRDLQRGRQSLLREFNDIAPFVVILSFAQVEKIHANLSEISSYLPNLLEK